MNDLIKRISDAKEMIEKKPNQSTVDYTIYGVLTDCEILLKEQEPEKEKIPEYPCRSCCSPSAQAACCGCEKERQWQAKYRKQDGDGK